MNKYIYITSFFGFNSHKQPVKNSCVNFVDKVVLRCRRVPTYYEIVAEDFSEDEETLEKQETFERKYNFRFEEPDQDFVSRLSSD